MDIGDQIARAKQHFNDSIKTNLCDPFDQHIASQEK